MNKFAKRMVGLTLGLALVGGVGLSFAKSTNELIKTNASTENSTTYDFNFVGKPASSGDIKLGNTTWSVSNVTNLGNFNSDYKGVQIGTSKATGSFTITSKYSWGAETGSEGYGAPIITGINLWMNAGSNGCMSASVTIGGVAATSDGTVVQKNSSATSQRDGTTKVSYTPGTTNTGVVSITFSSTKPAGYMCSIQVISESPTATSWATHFITTTDTPCADPTKDNREAVEAIWESTSSKYNELNDDEKALVKAATYEDENLGAAVKRYDTIISRYASESTIISDYIGRAESSGKNSSIITGDTNTAIAIAAVVTLVSVSAIGGYFFVKKTKHE